MAIAAVIGQSKWLWFKVPHKLVDVQSFEDASRGPLGALKFMARYQKGEERKILCKNGAVDK